MTRAAKKPTREERARARDLAEHAGAIARNRKEAGRCIAAGRPDLARILYETNAGLARAAAFDAEVERADADLRALNDREHGPEDLTAVEVLVAIADAYDANELDDEARKRWGKHDEHENAQDPERIVLYAGRGGRTLLTLADCFRARAALRGSR